ncbi:WD40-repeat-containing domain protein [Lipomyces arxii]|uniref:WD40-repeat-containing domain protein n=1 Tax=Lipomyces arxii TaxID=56418 RepID=UPI0034CEE517
MSAESTTPVAGDGDSGQIRITLTTRDASVAVPNVPLFVPLSLKRYGLSEVVNHLLATEKSIPFDFLINSKLLRESLHEYITHNGQSSEQTLAVEYTRSILPPTFLASYAHLDWVSSVDVISNSPAPVLSGCYDGIVRTWNLSGAVVSEFGGHTAPVKAVKWIDDRRLVSGGMDRSIRLWKVPVGDGNEATFGEGDEPVAVASSRIFTGHTSTVEDLAVNVRTSRMLSAGADGLVALWTTNYKEAPAASVPVSSREPSGKRRRKAALPSKGPISMLSSHTEAATGVIFDGNDPTVGYSASLDHTIKTWDLITGALVDTRSASYSLLTISQLPKLSLLVCGSSARHVTLHDPRAAESATSQTLHGHSNFVVSLSPSPESDYMFASASHDGTVRVWDVRAQSSLYVITRDSKSSPTDKGRMKVFDVHWSSNVGIVSGGEDKRVQVNRGTGLDTVKAAAANEEKK